MKRLVLGLYVLLCLPWLVSAQAGVSDTVPPSLIGTESGFFLSGSSAPVVDVTAAGAAVTVRLAITDDLSGASFSSGFGFTVMSLRSPSGAQFRTVQSWEFSLVSGTELDGVWEATLAMPQGSESGTWTVDYVMLRDVVGNTRTAVPGDPALAAFPDLEIVSDTDLTPPTLTDLALSSATLDTSASAQTLTVTLHVTDSQAGVVGALDNRGGVGLSSPPGFLFGRGCTIPSLLSGTPLDGVWSASCSLPQYSQAGTWPVEVTVIDAAGNSRSYRPTCQAWETTCAPVDPAWPTAVEVVSVPSDVTRPTLSSLSFSPNFIDTSLSSQQVEFRVHASDDLSGFSAVQIRLDSPSGGQTQYVTVGQWSRISGDPVNGGEFSGVATFPQYAESGTWQVQELFFYDNVFNYTFIGADYDPVTQQSVTGAQRIAALGFPTVLNVVRASLTGDGLIDPTTGNGGGTVVDDTFGDRAQITLPPGAVSGPTDVTIDVLQSPLTLPAPTGFAAPGTSYVNFQFNPYPAMPLPAPGATLTLPLLQGLPLGTPLNLFRVDVDPNTGQAFLQPSLDVNGNPVVGHAGPAPAVLTQVTYAHPADAGSSEVDAITPDLLLSRDSVYWDGYAGLGLYNQGDDVIEWALGTCAAPASPFLSTHDDLLYTYLDLLPGGVPVNLPGSDQCLSDVTSGLHYDIHWLTWDQGDGEFGYTRTPYGSGSMACDESGCMSVTFSGVAHLSTVVGLLADTIALTVPPSFVSGVPTVSFLATAVDTQTALPLPVSCVPASGSLFQEGATTVQCTATDALGLTKSASFTVTVDTQAPTLPPPATRVVTNRTTNTYTLPIPADPAPSSGGLITACVPSPASTFPEGPTQVTCSASDAAGNSSSTSFELFVDTQAPVFPPMSPIISNNPAFVYADPIPIDPAPSSAYVAINCQPRNGALPEGTTQVTCTATDQARNESSVTFAVTLDTITPALTLPGRIVTNNPMVTWAATASDPTPSGTVTMPVDCAPASNSVFAEGETLVTCVATDAAGNVASGQFTVVVDTQAPVFPPVPPFITNNPAFGYVDPMPVDPAPSSAYIVINCVPRNGALPEGTTLVTCTATDLAFNVSSVTFPVTVDTHAPVLTLPADIVTTTAIDQPPTGPVPVPVVCSPAAGPFPLGTTTVNCSATDAAGNRATGSFTVTVNSPPTVIDVSGQVGITYGGFTLNRTSGRWIQTLTLRNNGGTAVNGPLSLVLSSLSSHATLWQATGTTSMLYAGSPYRNLAPASLAPGASITIALEFPKAGTAGITYAGKVVAGPGTR